MKRIFLLPIVGVLSLGTLASYSTTARVTRHIPRNPGFMSGRTMN